MPAVIELISNLESKSLIAPTQGPQGDARFRQLESVRRYALKQLTESGEWDSTTEHLVAWLTRLATSFLHRFLTSGDVADRLKVEHDNLLHAVKYLANGTDDRQLLLLAALIRCGDVRGAGVSVRPQLDAALRIRDALPEYRAIALEQSAWLAARAGDCDLALTLAEEAVGLTRSLGNTAMRCRALTAFAYARQMRGEYAEACELFRECLAHVRELDEPDSIALCLNNLAWATILTGDLGQAVTFIKDALATCRHGKAQLLHTAGVVALEAGDTAEAEENFARSMKTDPPDLVARPYSLEGAAIAAMRGGGIERGLRLVAAAETIRRKSGHAVDPWWRERVSEAVACATDALPTRRVQVLLADGGRLTAQQAIDYALHDTLAVPRATGDVPGSLTKREHDVAVLVTQGLTNRDISERLRISERTVETHLGHIRTKLDLRTRAQIAAWVTGKRRVTRPSPV